MFMRLAGIITVVLATCCLVALSAPTAVAKKNAQSYKTELKIYAGHRVGVPLVQSVRSRAVVPSGRRAADIQLPANCGNTGKVDSEGKPVVSCKIIVRARPKFKLSSARAQQRSGAWVKLKIERNRATLEFQVSADAVYPFKLVRAQSRPKSGAPPFKVPLFDVSAIDTEPGCMSDATAFKMRCPHPEGGPGSSCQTGTAWQVLRAPDGVLYGDHDLIQVHAGQEANAEIPLTWKVDSDKLVMCGVEVVAYRQEAFGYVEGRHYPLSTGGAGGSGTASYNFPQEAFVYVIFKARNKSEK